MLFSFQTWIAIL